MKSRVPDRLLNQNNKEETMFNKLNNKLKEWAEPTWNRFWSIVAASFITFSVLSYIFLGLNFVEQWAGGIAAAISIFALIYKSQNYWIWSIVNAGLWLALFSSGSTKMLAGLQVSYILFSLYGFYQWAHVKFRIGYDPNVFTDNLGTIISTGIFIYTIVAYMGLSGYAGTKWWWIELAAVGISIASNWMDAFKYKGNWIGWTMTNILFGYLFFHLQLWGPFALTFLYQAFCVIGYIQWYREEKKLAREGKIELVGGAQYV